MSRQRGSFGQTYLDPVFRVNGTFSAVKMRLPISGVAHENESLCAALYAFAFGTTGCGKENKLPDVVLTALENATELELYSLNGDMRTQDGWHGAKILGQTTVTGDDVKKITAAVVKSVGEVDLGARCFIPRHGVRVTHAEKTYDLVICFECHWEDIYTDKNERPQRVKTSASAQELLNQILTDAKVPLAKPEK